MLSQFNSFIYQADIKIQPTNRVLLAVSGGVDSMVMVDLFAKSDIDFGIAHCNFQLRGAESDSDQQLVTDYGLKNDVFVFVEKFETKQYAKTQGISTQMAARDLRYSWFEKIRTTHNYDYIATAHHQDDNLETILLNLTRGTGLAGLHGIATRNNHVIRPMLFTNRQKIEVYALKNNIAWREDSSNNSTDYKRNKLRKSVLPILKEINPKVESAVYEMSRRIAATEHIIDQYFEQQVLHIDCQNISIKLLSSEPEPTELLNYILKKQGFSYGQCVAIWQNRDCETGKQYLSETHLLTKDRDCFVLSPVNKKLFGEFIIENFDKKATYPILNGELVFEQTDGNINLATDQTSVIVDADTLVFPLTVRPWQAGDWFCPLGMAGKRKKISDLLIDHKIPRNNKAEVLVIVSDHKIVWVVGLRLDERFRVCENSIDFIKINFKLNI